MIDEKTATPEAETSASGGGERTGDALAYHCPNCNAGLTFSPEKGSSSANSVFPNLPAKTSTRPTPPIRPRRPRRMPRTTAPT